MQKLPKNKLKLLFSEILNGCSIVENEKYGRLYIKHFDTFDSSDIETKRDSFFQASKKKGLNSEEQKLESLIENEDWSSAKENEIKKIENYISRLSESKRKKIVKKHKEAFELEIKSNIEKLETLQSEKIRKLGITCESYSSKKINEHLIFFSMFSDKSLDTPRFSKEEFDYLEDEELKSLSDSYGLAMLPFDDLNLKRLALTSHFLNFFYLCKDNPFIFFGKPIVELTFLQAELFNFGLTFKNIISDLKYDITEEMYDNPNLLLDTHDISKASKEFSEKTKDRSGVSLVGGSEEDYKNLGINTSDSVNLSDLAAKKGKKSLSMAEIMKATM